jgi:hypothetical protein
MDAIAKKSLDEPELAELLPYLDDFAHHDDESQATEANLEPIGNTLLDGFGWQHRETSSLSRPEPGPADPTGYVERRPF